MTGGALLIKKLAYYNKSTRDKSLRRIIDAWLPSQHQISDEDMKKLWKGLFYCLWHADKVTIHTDLIECISSLLLELPLSVAVNYLSVFLLTICREWPGIDSTRLAKFYNLIRRFMFCLLALLRKNSWDLQLFSKFMDVLEERVFFVDDKLQANGVTYHIVSVFLEELKKFLPVKKQVMEILLCRFILLMEKSRNKLLMTEIKSNVFDVVLEMGKRLLKAESFDNVDLDDNKDLVILGADSSKTQNLVPYNITSSKAKKVSDCNKRKRKKKLASFDFENVMSNLQVQFEVVASEMGLGDDGAASKKRKRSTRKGDAKSNTQMEAERSGVTANESRSKKVRFCMKNNLVWQPHNPLPSKSVRIPPSLRPRGSALKKGIPAGPIRDISVVAKKRVKGTRRVKKLSSRCT